MAANYEIDRVKSYQGGLTNWHTGQAALYGAYQNSVSYIIADAIIGTSGGNFKRNIEFSTIRREAKSHPKMLQGDVYSKIGVNFCFCDLLVQPFIGFEFGFYNQRKLHEAGAGFLNLNISGKTKNTHDSYLGTHVTTY